MEETVNDTVEQVDQSPPQKVSAKDFAAKIKTKYPQYKDISDDVLVQKIIEKYPDYKEQVDLSQKKNLSQNVVPNGSTTTSSGRSETENNPLNFDKFIPKELDNGEQPEGLYPNADPKKYETKLSTVDEKGFQLWLDNNYKQGKIQKGDYDFYKKNGYGYDYDFRAAFQANKKPEINKQDGKWHWDDIGKKPNEPTFSTQSKYNGVDGLHGGTWNGDNFIAPLNSPSSRELALGQMSRSDNTSSKSIEQTVMSNEEKINHDENVQKRKDYAEKVKKFTPVAIDNAAKKSLKVKGLDPNNTALLNAEKNKFTKAVESGDASVGFTKDGEAGLIDNPGFFRTFHDHMMSAIEDNKNAREFAKMNVPERVQFVKKMQEGKPSPYIGENPNYYGEVGGAVPNLALYGAGAATGAAIESVAPETGGLSNLALKPVMTFVMNAGGGANAKGMQGTLERYSLLKKNHPEMSDEEAMTKASSTEQIDRLAGIAETALFSKTGNELKLGKSTTGNFLKGMHKAGFDMAKTTAGVEGLRGIGHQLSGDGKSVESILGDMATTFKDSYVTGAELHGLMGALTGVAKVPALIKSALKYDVVTKMKPEEVQEALNKNVESGAITPEQGDKAIKDLTEFDETLRKVPANLSDEAKASVTGLILKRDNLKKASESLDESAKDLHNQEVESINNQIKEIYRTGKPLEHEINEATGEPYKQPTFDDIQKERVENLADKISKGKRIEDAEDLQAEAQFPDELKKELEKIREKEKPVQEEGKEYQPQSDIYKNVNKYLKKNEKPEAVELPTVELSDREQKRQDFKNAKEYEFAGSETGQKYKAKVATHADGSRTIEIFNQNLDNKFGGQLVKVSKDFKGTNEEAINKHFAVDAEIKEIKSGELPTVENKSDETQPLERNFVTPDGNRIEFKIAPEIDKVIVPVDGKKLFLGMKGRIFTLAKVGDKTLPFYISSEGTSGKQKGKWYPFFGQTESGWIIKGDIPEMEKGYNNSEIQKVQNTLNENLKVPTGLITPKGEFKSSQGVHVNLNDHLPFASFKDFNWVENPKDLNEKLGIKVPETIKGHDSKDVSDYISKQVSEIKSEQPLTVSEPKQKEPTVVEDKSENKISPPVEPLKENVPVEEGDGGIGITHADTGALRKETNLPDYEKTPQTVEQWKKDADERIADGKMPTLLRKMQKGEPIDEVEQIMIGKHIATLDAEVKSKPTNENIKALENAIQLSDMAGGTVWGRSGRARQETFLPDDSLGTALIKEKESLGIDELSQAQIDRVVKENAELAKVKEDLAKANIENQRLQREAAAKEELNKIRKEAKKSGKKTHDDFVKERDSYREELKAAKEKEEQRLRDKGIHLAGASFTLTTDMVKAIGKIIKSHAEETVLKFDDLVNKVFDDVKDIIDGVSKTDIIDVMRGAYAEKKITVNEAAAKLRDFRSEAKLLKKLQDLRLGKEPVSEKAKTEKSRRVIELENKIKEIRQRNKDDTPVEKTDAERLAAKRKFIQKSIDEIEKDIKAGKFEKPKRLAPVILDKKTRALEDRLLDLEAQQAIRRAKNDYEKTSKFSKAADTFWQVLGLKRLVNAAIDFSILFRQASPVTMNLSKYIPYMEDGKLRMNTAPKAIANMFNLAFDPKGFKRFQYNLEKSEDGRIFTHFNGVFSNPTEVKMEKREEEFSNSLLTRIHQKIESGDNETLKKAADIAERAWFSERAAAALLNSIRIQEFSKEKINLMKRGITPENSPEVYKELVKWEMNKTGRGNLIKALEDSHAGRVIANRAYFGARLMAAKINMLNPYYYAKMPKELRAHVLKDLAGNVSTMILTGIALKAVGASVSVNPDDPDFLQVRFGDKVYDISGGSAGYVRTFLRLMSGVAKEIKNPNTKETKSYLGFAGSSAWKSLVANKLSPNTAYAYHFFTGKSADYDAAGHLKPFDPYEFAKVYPLYVDGTIQAYKQGGIGDALAIMLPDLFGIGTQQYNRNEGGKGGGGGATSTVPKFKQPSIPKPK